MYERNFSMPLGGDLYRLQREAQRRAGEHDEPPNELYHIEPPPREPRYPPPPPPPPPPSPCDPCPPPPPPHVKKELDMLGKLFKNIQLEDLILIGLIIFLMRENSDKELIIILAVLLFMGIK
ncbi:MAG: hypothetical protein Q8865_07230 [Bacillota bacterium]|nr:hypothetical protein [Bacillota bacterium]